MLRRRSARAVLWHSDLCRCRAADTNNGRREVLMQTWRSDMAIYRRLFLQARPYWLHIAGIFLLSLFDSPLGLIAPLPLKIAVDSGIGSQPLPAVLNRVLPANLAGSPSGIFLLAALLMVGVAALAGLLGLASAFLRSYTAEQLILNFRT